MYIDQPTSDTYQQSIIWTPTTCDKCFGIGHRISPTGKVERCPTLTVGDEAHVEITGAGRRIDRAIELLRRRGLEPDPVHFDIARSLSHYSTDVPCSSHELIERHFSYVPGAENRRRLVTRNIRYLRDIWLLPLASRKEKPAGYWISIDEQDFRDYVDRALAAAKTEFSTIHRMAKANYPEFAEQLEINFFNDMEPEPVPTMNGRDMSDVAAKLRSADAAAEFVPFGEPIPYDVGSEGITLSEPPASAGGQFGEAEEDTQR
ncbi:MAG: hypothetical protein ACJ79X_06785 [Gemmatimonadaceae bacterium]|jgi:hypothetical protein